MYTNVIGKGPPYADPQSISTVRRESNSNPSWLLPWEPWNAGHLLGNPVNAAKGKKGNSDIYVIQLPENIQPKNLK